jgi:hypothetical protein
MRGELDERAEWAQCPFALGNSFPFSENCFPSNVRFQPSGIRCQAQPYHQSLRVRARTLNPAFYLGAPLGGRVRPNA